MAEPGIGRGLDGRTYKGAPPDLPPLGGSDARCGKCTHPITWHDGEGCRYGCGCADAHGKTRRAHIFANGLGLAVDVPPPAPAIASPWRLLAAAALMFARTMQQIAEAEEASTPAAQPKPSNGGVFNAGDLSPRCYIKKGCTLAANHRGPCPIPATSTSAPKNPLAGPVLEHPSAAPPAPPAPLFPSPFAGALAGLTLPGNAIDLLAIIANEGGLDGITHVQARLSSGYSARTVTEYTRQLLNADLLTKISKSVIAATDAGRTALGDNYKPMPQSGAKLRAMWRDKLSPGPREIFNRACDVYPASISFAELRETTSYSDRTISEYTRQLLRRELVTRNGKSAILAQAHLFSKKDRR